ncbi:MAG: LysM domain-containing protein [bacterium]
MNIKVGNTNLKPLPDSLSIQSPEKIAQIELPDTQDVFQDFGPGPKRFYLTGIFKNKNGGLTQALNLDAVKNQGEEIIFSIDNTASWKVRIQSFNFDLLRRGNVRYALDMVEVSEPEPFVFMPQPELYGPDRMDVIIASLKLKAKGFTLTNALANVHNAIWKIEEALSDIKNIIKGIRRLTELPYSQLNLLKFELGLIELQCEIIMAEAKKIIDAPQRNYSAVEEMLKYVYQYAQLTKNESGFMYAAANAVPKKEQVHIVTGNDTLMSISLNYYGSYVRWSDIAGANDIMDPTTIEVGQELMIPE